MTIDPETKNERTRVVSFMSVIFFLLVLMLPIGFLRRRHRSIVLKSFAWLIYTATTALIPYVFGLMRTSHGHQQFPPLWAVVLVFTYGSVDKVNALDLNDQRSIALIWVKNIVHFGFAFILLIQFWEDDPSPWSFYIFCCLLYAYYKVVERVIASQYANGNDPALVKLVSNVSKFMGKYPNDHMIDPHYETITLDKVLACDDGFILSCTDDSTIRLKTTCLSFSLFWLLLHRFVGVPSYENSNQVTAREFINHAMLTHYTNPFQVIELELAFLYDYIYSKHFLFYMKGFCCQVMKQFVFHGLFTWFAIYRFVFSSSLKSFYDVRKFGLTIMIMMELIQFIVFLSSRWSKMMILCIYVKRESWKKKTLLDHIIMKVTNLICLDRGETFKPWQRKLGQYSLLESFSSRRHFIWKIGSMIMSALTGIKIMRPGRMPSHDINLTTEIQEAVIKSLQRHGPKLSKGIESLKVNDHLISSSVNSKLIRVCKQLSIDTQAILVWHLATAFCEINPQLTTRVRESVDFRVATSLSRYCVYLVAFAPDLLPGHPATTDYICTEMIEEAYECMKDCDESWKIYKKVVEEAGDHDLEVGERNMESSLEQAVMLVKVLDGEIGDAGKRWKVLAELWAEMILYLAPNMNNECAHVERLADGGEFITHLWVLLFHAGIVDREFAAR